MRALVFGRVGEHWTLVGPVTPAQEEPLRPANCPGAMVPGDLIHEGETAMSIASRMAAHECRIRSDSYAVLPVGDAQIVEVRQPPMPPLEISEGDVADHPALLR